MVEAIMPSKRSVDKTRPMDHAERLAKAVIEALVPGSKMEYREEQSQGARVYDFDLCYADGRVAAAEATASVNEVQARANARIADRRRGGPQIEPRLCRKSWLIFPRSDDIDNIRKHADEDLAALESAGLESFWHSSHPDLCHKLGVFGGAVVLLQKPAICINRPHGGGATGAIRVLEAASREAWKIDNRRKLGASGCSERHLLVYMPLTNPEVACVLADFQPPIKNPDLPPEITDVWAFGETLAEGEIATWRASTNSPWRSLGVVRL